jgi:hypothetical protein
MEWQVEHPLSKVERPEQTSKMLSMEELDEKLKIETESFERSNEFYIPVFFDGFAEKIFRLPMISGEVIQVKWAPRGWKRYALKLLVLVLSAISEAKSSATKAFFESFLGHWKAALIASFPKGFENYQNAIMSRLEMRNVTTMRETPHGVEFTEHKGKKSIVGWPLEVFRSDDDLPVDLKPFTILLAGYLSENEIPEADKQKRWVRFKIDLQASSARTLRHEIGKIDALLRNMVTPTFRSLTLSIENTYEDV